MLSNSWDLQSVRPSTILHVWGCVFCIVVVLLPARPVWGMHLFRLCSLKVDRRRSCNHPYVPASAKLQLTYFLPTPSNRCDFARDGLCAVELEDLLVLLPADARCILSCRFHLTPHKRRRFARQSEPIPKGTRSETSPSLDAVESYANVKSLPKCGIRGVIS